MSCSKRRGRLPTPRRPTRSEGFLKQRFRWVFGTLQAAWKQRDALASARFGALGMMALPNLLVFRLLFPLDRAGDGSADGAGGRGGAHSAASTPGRYSAEALTRTLFFYSLFVAVDLGAALLAFFLEQEDKRLLVWLPLQRIGIAS